MSGLANADLRSTLTWVRQFAVGLILSGAAATSVVAENRQAGGAATKTGEPAPGFDVQSLGGVNLQLAKASLGLRHTFS